MSYYERYQNNIISSMYGPPADRTTVQQHLNQANETVTDLIRRGYDLRPVGPTTSSSSSLKTPPTKQGTHPKSSSRKPTPRTLRTPKRPLEPGQEEEEYRQQPREGTGTVPSPSPRNDGATSPFLMSPVDEPHPQHPPQVPRERSNRISASPSATVTEGSVSRYGVATTGTQYSPYSPSDIRPAAVSSTPRAVGSTPKAVIPEERGVPGPQHVSSGIDSSGSKVGGGEGDAMPSSSALYREMFFQERADRQLVERLFVEREEHHSRQRIMQEEIHRLTELLLAQRHAVRTMERENEHDAEIESLIHQQEDDHSITALKRDLLQAAERVEAERELVQQLQAEVSAKEAARRQFLEENKEAWAAEKVDLLRQLDYLEKQVTAASGHIKVMEAMGMSAGNEGGGVSSLYPQQQQRTQQEAVVPRYDMARDFDLSNRTAMATATHGGLPACHRAQQRTATADQTATEVHSIAPDTVAASSGGTPGLNRARAQHVDMTDLLHRHWNEDRVAWRVERDGWMREKEALKQELAKASSPPSYPSPLPVHYPSWIPGRNGSTTTGVAEHSSLYLTAGDMGTHSGSPPPPGTATVDDGERAKGRSRSRSHRHNDPTAEETDKVLSTLKALQRDEEIVSNRLASAPVLSLTTGPTATTLAHPHPAEAPRDHPAHTDATPPPVQSTVVDQGYGAGYGAVAEVPPSSLSASLGALKQEKVSSVIARTNAALARASKLV